MTPPTEQDLLAELGEHYFEAKHSYDPFNATLLGLTQYDGVTGSPSTETSADAEAKFADLSRQVSSLDAKAMTNEQQLDQAVLLSLLEGARADADYSLWAANVSGAGYVSRQGTLLQALAATDVLDSDSADRYLNRVSALPRYFRELGERYRHEVGAGRVPTAVGVRNAIGQLRSETSAGPSSTLLRPVASTEGAPWRAEAETIVRDAITPAMDAVAALLEREALPVARSDDKVGICWLADGEEAYAAALAQHTTTDLSAEKVHQLGIDALTDLDHSWAEIGQQAYGLTDRRAIAQRLRADPSLRFETRAQIVQLVADALHRAEDALPRYFPDHVQVGPCDIVELSAEESANSALAYYRPPTTDGGRNGAQCIATSDPTTRSRYEYEALSFHESVPGHHLQLATSQQLQLPRYRRHLDIEVCGFNEGWGLYTEQLADELNLYSDDYARLGMLSMQALRACRMVVDTGMHAMGWTRQRAIDFMWENTATTRDHIEHEVDRYIAWPGQACAYGVGKSEILRIRAKAQQVLSARFELPAFHWELIRNGAIPLSVADAAITDWLRTHA